MNTIIQFSKKYARAGIGFGLIAIMALAIAAPSFAIAALTRQLELGAVGADVSSLQAFLAQDATIYPQGLVTGYFGPLTKAAVIKFQVRNGIDPVGRVGPITLAVINAQMGGVIIDTGGYAPIISNVSVNVAANSANVSWVTNETAKGVVYYSAAPLATYDRPNSVDVSGSIAFSDTSLRSSQNIAITGLQSNTVYYYLAYTTDASGNVTVTAPSMFKTN